LSLDGLWAFGKPYRIVKDCIIGIYIECVLSWVSYKDERELAYTLPPWLNKYTSRWRDQENPDEFAIYIPPG